MLLLLVILEKEILFLLIRILLSRSMLTLIPAVLCLRFRLFSVLSLPLSRWLSSLSSRTISPSFSLLICLMRMPSSMLFLVTFSFPLRLPTSRLLFVVQKIFKSLMMKKPVLSQSVLLPRLPLLLQVLLLLLLLQLLLVPDVPPVCQYWCVVDPVSAAIIGGMGLFGSLGAGMLTSSSMDSANRLNQKNFSEQMDFAKYQYENSKQYNSARSQVARLRAAGLNPILAMQGGAQAGQVSAVSQPSPTPQQPVDYSPYLSGASSLIGGLTEAGLFGSTEAEKLAGATKSLSDAAKSKADAVRTGVATEQDRVTLNVMRQTEQALVRQQWNEVMRQELENESIGLQNVYKEFTNGYLPTQLWKGIENTIADTALKVAQREATPLNARAAITHAVAAYNESLKQNGFYLTEIQQENLIDATLDFTLSQAYKNWLTPGYSSSLKLPFGTGGSVTNPLPEGERRARSVYRNASIR